MHRGYSKRWRKRWDRGYHLDPYLWILMDYFIDFANYKDSEVYFPKHGLIPLKRGQHIFGTRKLAAFIGVNRQLLRNRLDKLKKIGFLTLQSTHQYTIATVINYDVYQPFDDVDNPQNNQRSTRGEPAVNPRSTTPNKVNKGNKDKKVKDTDSAELKKSSTQPPILTIPLVSKDDNGDRHEHPIYQADINGWLESYPAVDVLQELKNIREWNLSNPTRMKTRKGIRRHITSWLAREQDRGGKLAGTQEPKGAAATVAMMQRRHGGRRED